jgi:hypothetical protein
LGKEGRNKTWLTPKLESEDERGVKGKKEPDVSD